MGKAVDRLISLSAVKAHTRRTKGGKVVQVKNYTKWFHGTMHTFEPGEVITPSKERVRTGTSSGEHVYFAPEVEDAAWYALPITIREKRERGDKGHVYQVEPLGEVEPDPDIPAGSFRAKSVRVLAEVKS